MDCFIFINFKKFPIGTIVFYQINIEMFRLKEILNQIMTCINQETQLQFWVAFPEYHSISCRISIQLIVSFLIWLSRLFLQISVH